MMICLGLLSNTIYRTGQAMDFFENWSNATDEEAHDLIYSYRGLYSFGRNVHIGNLSMVCLILLLLAIGNSLKHGEYDD